MAVPWLQIVKLVPSIVEVSRELMKRTARPTAPLQSAPGDAELASRIMALEENERRQAQLVSQMAEQMAGLTSAVTVLHRRIIWLSVGCSAAVVLALVAVVLLVNRG